MESTCSELLDCCLRGETWPGELLNRALAEQEGRAFLSIVVERLGDLFEPRLCQVYEELFRAVIGKVCPELKARVRQGPARGRPARACRMVYVLSRVTLGADVAVSSVLLDAAKRRYPGAEIVFVAPRKNYELFAGDPRIRHLDAPYARTGALRDRLQASASLWFEDGIVLDPDSRLTQLGVISVCPEPNYFWFNSRMYGGQGNDRLPDLAARWAREVLDVEDAQPYIAPLPSDEQAAEITVSLGVGENPAKRISDNFERDLLAILVRTGCSVLVDEGGSEEESARVHAILPPGARTHRGAFAPFAARIARSRLFVGYDSAAGHVASACGVPQIAIMNGFVSERMLARWRPLGTMIRGNDANPLGAVERAVSDILASARRLV